MPIVFWFRRTAVMLNPRRLGETANLAIWDAAIYCHAVVRISFGFTGLNLGLEAIADMASTGWGLVEPILAKPSSTPGKSPRAGLSDRA